MSNPIYLYTDLSTAVNAIVHGQIGNLVSERATHNRAVRSLLGSVDLRSAKRKSAISPGIYGSVYSYAAPADLKDDAVVDIQRQIKRSEQFFLTTPEEFDRRKTYDKGMVAFDDHDFLRFLLLSTEIDTKEVILDDFEATTGWTVAGDGSNLAVDNVDFINGSASLSFDGASSNTAITLTKSTIGPLDLTIYKGHEVFLWVKVPNITGLTNFILKWGSDASNYYSQTVTTTHEGLAFYTGSNLLRFNWPTTTTGTPDVTKISYLQLTITKTNSMAAQTGWHVDWAVARQGDIHSIVYYSKYGWQNTGNTYIENSTADTDLVVADTDEFDLIVAYSGYLAGQELRIKDLKQVEADFEKLRKRYLERYSSDRLLLQTTYHRLSSLEGDMDVLNNTDRNAGDND